jgi:hypothetical protein
MPCRNFQNISNSFSCLSLGIGFLFQIFFHNRISLGESDIEIYYTINIDLGFPSLYFNKSVFCLSYAVFRPHFLMNSGSLPQGGAGEGGAREEECGVNRRDSTIK